MSELAYGGKTLAEIAGYSTAQLRWVIGRKRDKNGQLIRRGTDDLPEWVKVDGHGFRVLERDEQQPFHMMYLQVKRKQGLNGDEATVSWNQYLEENPGLAFRERRAGRLGRRR